MPIALAKVKESQLGPGTAGRAYMAGAKAAYHAVNSGWYSEDEDEFEEAMSTLSEPSARQSLSSEDLREQVPSADATAGVPLSANQAASLWPGHDAVYSNASDRLRTLLSSNTISVHALDPVGNTVSFIWDVSNIFVSVCLLSAANFCIYMNYHADRSH